MLRHNVIRWADSSCSRLLNTRPRGLFRGLEQSTALVRSFLGYHSSMSTLSDSSAELSSLQNTNEEASSLSRADLIARVNNLQAQLQAQTAKIAALTAADRATTTSRPEKTSRKPKKAPKPFDPSLYSTRLIALKISYLGHRYNGFEHASGTFTARPTIEEALWKALRKARLIFPPLADGVDDSFEVIFDEGKRYEWYFESEKTHPDAKHGKVRLELNWDGCQYSKCGRTDRGVSAFGQVVGIRVRSRRPKSNESSIPTEVNGVGEDGVSPEVSESPVGTAQDFNPIDDELPYISMLNTVLPPDIRVLAWCPDLPEDFDARFSCEDRRYKYLFTNPAFCPTPGQPGLLNTKGQRPLIREGWLDIDKMKEAAKKFEGLHDFRNFCKIDASKQMPKCERRINFADIGEFEYSLDGIVKQTQLNAQGESFTLSSIFQKVGIDTIQGPRVYAFSVHGSAFLWHQVRCMVAILFLVGQGLEQPEIVDELLDIDRNPTRPSYEMAHDAPLVLWDCTFPAASSGTEDGLNWLYAGDAATLPSLTSIKADGKFGLGGVVDEIWKQWQEAKLKEAQLAGLLGLTIKQGDGSSLGRGGFRNPATVRLKSQKVCDGSGAPRLVGDYQPVMQKPRLGTLEEQNAKYVAGKGARRNERKAQDLDTGD